MTKYIFFMLLTMSNVIYSMESTSVRSLSSDSSEKNLKRKRNDSSNFDLSLKNLASTDIHAEPNEAKYHIKCPKCAAETYTPWGASKMRHRKKCSYKGQEGWDTEPPTLFYDIDAKCPYFGIPDNTNTLCTFTNNNPSELAQVARIKERLYDHVKTKHPKLAQLTPDQLKLWVNFRQNPEIVAPQNSEMPARAPQVKKVKPTKRTSRAKMLEKLLEKEETDKILNEVNTVPESSSINNAKSENSAFIDPTNLIDPTNVFDY